MKSPRRTVLIVCLAFALLARWPQSSIAGGRRAARDYDDSVNDAMKVSPYDGRRVKVYA